MRVIWCGVLACALTAQAQIPVVASFDSALKRDLDQSKFSVQRYQQTIRTTMRSFVPEGDSLKSQLLSALSRTSGKDAELGMIAAALVPFHDPTTVKPLLDRAARDSVVPFIATSITHAAAAVLSMSGAAPGPKPSDPRWALLLATADSALTVGIGHVNAKRLRYVYDAGHGAKPPGGDYCEGMSYVSYDLVGVLDLRDRDILEPVVDTSGGCALGPVLLALSYAANQDFLSSWGTVREPDARIKAVAAAASRAREWWRNYLHDHPDGDWRPAARAGLLARGYPLTSKGFLEAVNDTNRIVRYNAYRLLNTAYDTHADLDPVFGFGYVNTTMGYPPEDAAASDTTLRNYWRRRLQGH